MDNGNRPSVKNMVEWKHRGLLVPPKSRRQGMLAIDAKNFIEGLGCYGEVRRMVALGKRPGEVARFILEERGERPGVTFNSVKKYLQVYRRFFVSPLETLKAKVDNRTEGVPRVVDRKLNGLLGKIQEIEALEQKVHAQAKRIDSQMEREKDLGGLPFPGLRLEMMTFKEMLHELVEMKMNLGYPGYQRVAQNVDIRHQMSLTRIQQLSSEERQQLVEFGRTIYGLIEIARTKGNSEGPPEQSLPQ